MNINEKYLGEVEAVEDEAPDAEDVKDWYPGRVKAADLLNEPLEVSRERMQERIARESQNPIPGWGSGSRGFERKLKQLNRELFKRSQEKDRQLEAERQTAENEPTS